MSKTWRMPFLIGSVARLAYGLGAMFAPEWMAEHLAPTVQGHPDPRMNLRGFGGAHTGIALYSLAVATSPEQARSVLGLNALVDALDAATSVLEWRARGKLDRVVGGGVAINVLGLACWTAAGVALKQRPPPQPPSDRRC